MWGAEAQAQTILKFTETISMVRRLLLSATRNQHATRIRFTEDLKMDNILSNQVPYLYQRQARGALCLRRIRASTASPTHFGKEESRAERLPRDDNPELSRRAP